MALTTYGKNEALAYLGKGPSAGGHPTKWMEYVTLFGIVSGGAVINQTVTSAGSTITWAAGKFLATGKFAVGKWIIFESITGGEGKEGSKEIVAGRPYLIKEVTETTLEVTDEEGGTAIKPEKEVTHITAVCLEETAKARVATGFGAASHGEISDAARTLEVESGKTIRYAAWYSQVSGEYVKACMSITKLEAEESFGATGKYELTSDKLTLNPIEPAAVLP